MSSLVGLLLAALLLAPLAGCTLIGNGSLVDAFRGDDSGVVTSGQKLVGYKNDIEALTRGAGVTMSDAEVRAIAVRPLPLTKGLALDLALLTRAIAQSLQHDRLGVAQTRDDALRRGTDREVILAVLSLHAGTLRTAGMSHAARQAYAEAEGYMLESARRNGKPLHSSPWHRSFVLDYLFAALRLGDVPLGNLIAARYLEPLLIDDTVDPSMRLIARLYLHNYSIIARTAWGGGDPLAGYHDLDRLISRHRAAVSRMSDPYGPVARNTLMDLRIHAGYLALRAHRPSLAAAQLRAVESETSNELAKRFAIEELRIAVALSDHQYERALEALDAMRQRLPALISGVPVIRVNHQIGRANVLASLGRWEEAAREIEAVHIDASHLALIDHYAGLMSVVRAMLGREDPDLETFVTLQTKYRDGSQGIDRSVLYFAAQTAIFHQRGARSGSMLDAASAVDGGRQLSRFLRLRQAVGLADQSALSPLFLRISKEAYALSAIRALGTQGVTMDDVLDAAQLLQTSDIDQDIAAAAQRLRSIAGVEPNDLRALQNLQRRVAVTQAALGAALSAADGTPTDTQRSVDEANAASDEFDRRLAGLARGLPGLRYAFGGVEAQSLRDIQSRLAADEALLTAAPMSTSTLVVIITKNGFASHVAPAGEAELSALVDRVRRSTNLSSSARLPDFDVDAARQLHRLLLGWGPQLLRGVTSVTVAASGPLAAMPFGLLVRDTGRRVSSLDYRRLPWLIRSVALAHVPSISSWLALTDAPSRPQTDGFLAWADPDFTGQALQRDPAWRGVRASLVLPRRAALEAVDASPATLAASLPPLPEARTEAQAMAKALRASVETDVLTGLAATRRSVIERSASGDLARRSVVLFATHGVAPDQVPGLDQPALVMAHDPADPEGILLTLDDVLSLRLNADWVILSACNTASADRDGGDALSGLSRGFFFAGARGMLVTHWEVESESAAEISTRTVAAYAASSSIGRAQALQQASLALIEGRGTTALWSHPAYWAPYALVGDGQRRRPGR